MGKHVLILSSSPRPNGNSRALCASLLQGALSAGHTAEILDVAALQIHPCGGCEYCYLHSNQCVIRDDMDLVWEKIDCSDVLVFASPIYFFHFSAQLKLVIDRLYARYRTMHPTESALLLTAADGESVMKAAKLTYQKIVKCCGLTDRGMVLAPHVWEAGDIQEHPALGEAYQLGASL